MGHRVILRLVGSGYHVNTLKDWLLYIKPMVEELVGMELVIVEEHDGLDWPRLYINNYLILEGLPDNEGTLAEVLVHVLRRRER